MALPQGQVPGSPGTTPGQFNNPSTTQNSGANNLIGPAPGALASTAPTVGSPSEVTGWVPDILTIIQDACEQAGFDFTSPYSLRTAKRSIDFLAMEWANRGYRLWTLDLQITPLQPNTGIGAGPYPMPVDTIDMVFPAIRQYWNDGTFTDTLITREDYKEYLSLPNKLTSIGKPSIVYVHRINPAPELFVWSVPDANGNYALVWWRARRIQNTGYATNLMDVPFRFIPALIKGLAWALALKKSTKDYMLIQTLKNNYEESWREARGEDQDKGTVRIIPGGYPY